MSKPTKDNHEGTQEQNDERTNSNIGDAGIRDSVNKSLTETIVDPVTILANESINKMLLKETTDGK